MQEPKERNVVNKRFIKILILIYNQIPGHHPMQHLLLATTTYAQVYRLTPRLCVPLACTIVHLVYIIIAVLVVVVVVVFLCLFLFVCLLAWFSLVMHAIRFSQGTYQKVTNDPH